MAQIISESELQVEFVGGKKLGMIWTKETAFKASFILSPAFREPVIPAPGWPVYVIIPCRDFVYLISERERNILGRLGSVVIKKYRNSGNPLT